ncbi:two-component system response regulator YesN [Paenibacillus taihuensis]|uniref:Two-component system response regulator YesN n=1 Tax=Paenibacillus taihuensis TaxID=1156355 RepID=A0A3D9QX57_9BACL|nr:response regulator [Paenibacillus taihuensis]REE70508.1 two-component system response regulator YesN [Paenibacillus taihuensis]
MVSMLVVDDEIYALKGITQGIDWSDLPIGSILEAEDATRAIRLLEEHSVDLIISDIEMPGLNGLELLRWTRDNRPQTLTIFLTGHARFDYAQEALHNGCFDYILKPVDHDTLKEIVIRALAEIELRRERQQFEEIIDINRRQWKNQLPILVERFWQELLSGRVRLSPGRLNRQFEYFDIPLNTGSRVLPVLLSIEQWDIELDARDESIMEYALRKSAAEIILGEWPGTVLQDRNELNMVLLYLNEGDTADRAALLRRCSEYVDACQSYFHCRVSCYVGEDAGLGGLSSSIDRLQQLERSNVSAPQSVQDAASSGYEMSGAGTGIQLPSFADWGALLDNGSYEQLGMLVEDTLKQWQSEQASREALELFHYGMMSMMYRVAYRKGFSIYDVFTVSELKDYQVPRNSIQLLAWASKMVYKMGQAIAERPRDASAVIAKVQSFIHENLHKELTRDDIAASVYRNPAYLSRLYRKETGSSLSDYITEVRIERAKRLLIETNDKVSNIAEGVGYVHFSYFAKLFKKMTGLSPQEYRKMYQILH